MRTLQQEAYATPHKLTRDREYCDVQIITQGIQLYRVTTINGKITETEYIGDTRE